MFLRKNKLKKDYEQVLDFSKVAYEQLFDCVNDNFLVSTSIIDDGFSSLFLMNTLDANEETNGWVLLTLEDLENEELDLSNTYVVNKDDLYKAFPVVFALILFYDESEMTVYRFDIDKDGICGFLDLSGKKKLTYSDLTGHSISATNI